MSIFFCAMFQGTWMDLGTMLWQWWDSISQKLRSRIYKSYPGFGEVGMGPYLYIPFLGGWTSINPSYFDVHQGDRVLTHPQVTTVEVTTAAECWWKSAPRRPRVSPTTPVPAPSSKQARPATHARTARISWRWRVTQPIGLFKISSENIPSGYLT